MTEIDDTMPVTALQQQVEARYQAVLEDQTNLVVGFTEDGTLSCFSRGFSIFLNAADEHLRAQNIYNMVYEQDLPSLREALLEVERGQTIIRDLRLSVDGRMARLKWHIRGVYHQDKLIEYQASARITSGDFMTRAQLEDGWVFRRLTENMPVMLYLFGSRKFLYVNRSFEEKFGYKHMELLNMDFWELVHPDFREIAKERGLAILEGKEGLPASTEVKGIRKNGEIIWADTFVNIIDINGEPVGLVAAYDITERKRLEKAVEQANRELENRVQERTAELRRANQELTTLNNNLNNIMKNMSDGVLLFNREGQVKVLNPDFEKSWGHAVRDWRTYVDMQYFRRRVFEEGAFVPDEELIVPTARGQAHFLASASPIFDEEGKVSGCLVMVRPIEKVHRLVQRFAGARARFGFEDIITHNPKMFGVIETAKKAASSQSMVLIEGESGTGKEMFAHAIHNASSREKGPFVALNCAAIPRELVGSEMFGYVEGAFTGAKRGGNPGKFELASGGTLFLDEIGDMPFEQQAVLLRVIQEKQLTRIGGDQLFPVNARIICATNKDLWEAVRAGTFRQDLYYRLNVINVKIPPLRERVEDIQLLLEHYLQKAKFDWNTNGVLDAGALKEMKAYKWPGNVRELQNLVEKMVHAAEPRAKLREWLNEVALHKDEESGAHSSYYNQTGQSSIRQVRERQRQSMMDQESARIIELLEKYRGNVSRVAREMGMARSTLYKKMSDYRIGE